MKSKYDAAKEWTEYGVRTDLFALCWRWRRGRLRREEEAARPDGLSIPISNLRRPLLKGFRLYGGWDGGAAADGEPDQTGRAEEERLELGEEKGRKEGRDEGGHGGVQPGTGKTNDFGSFLDDVGRF